MTNNTDYCKCHSSKGEAAIRQSDNPSIRNNPKQSETIRFYIIYLHERSRRNSTLRQSRLHGIAGLCRIAPDCAGLHRIVPDCTGLVNWRIAIFHNLDYNSAHSSAIRFNPVQSGTILQSRALSHNPGLAECAVSP